MTTLAYAPDYPVPGREVVAKFTLTETATNYIRVWCTVAPEGSELDTKIKTAAGTSSRVQVYEGDGGDAHPWRAKFDKGGAYTLVCQEYTKGTGFSGGYQGDTRANQEETKVGSEATVYVYIGKRHLWTAGTGQDTAELAFWIWNQTIRATTLALHGEVTPAIVNARSPRAAVAAKASGVTTALASLVGQAASTVIGTPSTIISNFVTKFNAHIILTAGSVHAAADSDNTIKLEFSAAPTPQSITAFVTEALRRLRQHETNDSGTGVGSASSSYHSPGAVDAADMLNQPQVRGVGGTEDAYAALAELWRCYEAHRASTAVHGAADSTNTLTALTSASPILEVHRAFFAALASTTPSAVPGDTSGSALLKAWGAREG